MEIVSIGENAGQKSGGDVVVDRQAVVFKKMINHFAGGRSGWLNKVDEAVIAIGGVVIDVDYFVFQSRD